MTAPPPLPSDKALMRRTLEIAIRIGVLVLLATWCFVIVRPFIIPIAWGVILAVALHPPYRRLVTALYGRGRLAAALLTLLLLGFMVGPAVMLAGTLVDGVQSLAQHLSTGSFAIPPPPASVGAWPVIGEPLERFWLLASVNLQAALEQIAPQFTGLGKWLLATAAGAAMGILQFAFAIVIAGVLLSHARSGHDAVYAIAGRLAGVRGAGYADLAQATVRSVTRGIIGVALIQSLLAGIGFLAAGVPGAGFLALICLFLSVVQIGPGLVIVPTIVYVFATSPSMPAVIFMVWSLLVILLDNALKPVLMGRGLKVPMVVIFVGAIGGFLTSGIIGLFVGAVILSLGYELFRAWLQEDLPGEVPMPSGEP